MPKSTIQVALSATPRAIDNSISIMPFLTRLWKQNITQHALRAFVTLHIADVMGGETLTIDEICERTPVKNPNALQTIFHVLKTENIVTQNESNSWSLTAMGAYLQHNSDGNRTAFALMLTDADIFKALTRMSVHIVDDKILLHPEQIQEMIPVDEDNWKELNSLVGLIDPTCGRVVYCGIDDHAKHASAVLQTDVEFVPDLASIEDQVDLLILHRFFLFQRDVLGEVAKSISTYGRVAVIEACRDDMTSCDDLMLSIAKQHKLPTVDEWVAFFSDELNPVKMKTVRPGVILFLLQPPLRV